MMTTKEKNEAINATFALIKDRVIHTMTGAGYDANQVTVEDITNDVVVKLLDGGLDKYDPTRAKLTTFVAWVATNATIDALRKQRKVVRIDGQGRAASHDEDGDDAKGFEILPASFANPERNAIVREKARKLHRALARLSETDRLIFETLAEDASEAACAPVMEKTGLSLSNIRKRLCLAKQRLAADLAA